MASLLVSAVTLGTGPLLTQAANARDVLGPSGSEAFGTDVLVLSNGNYAVTDPMFDSATHNDVGAVYLYDGATNHLISTLTGSAADDRVGGGGLFEVGTNDIVAVSDEWNSTFAHTGAVTWIDGTTGLNGQVTTGNSLVGATAGDSVGSGGVTVLSNGNYVVASPNWWNAGTFRAGAATWVDGSGGVSDEVNAANSLVGTAANDQVGSGGVTALAGNGNYVVNSPMWDNGGTNDAGAVTWGDASGGTVGDVDATNSLVGETADDNVGANPITALPNGNYVVATETWDDGATQDVGAVTWRNGTGISANGPISVANSLIGTTAGDLVGVDGVHVLTNGNYVVSSEFWSGTFAEVGAVTWGDGASGTSGVVGAGNSLVGSTVGDHVGITVVALANNHYVVGSPDWDHAGVDVGAATWANGGGGTIGAVTVANSLIGTTANDNVGTNVTPLSNGSYVVGSPRWNNAAVIDAGAATWVNGASTGVVSTGNSLFGTTANDNVGDRVTALTNVNYVVGSRTWDNGAITDAGAATWGNGATGTIGAVTSANSLVGSAANDSVGLATTALTDGNYVVSTPLWDGATADAGAATWGNGATGITGGISAGNSLVDSRTSFIGMNGVFARPDGTYVVVSNLWRNPQGQIAGGVTYGPAGGVAGLVASTNSAFGTPPGLIGGVSELLTTDDAYAVSTFQNRVLLLRTDAPIFATPPSNIIVTAAPGASSAIATYTNPVAISHGASLPVGCTPPSGSHFLGGVTTVICTATDDTGYTATTSFTVTVNGTVPPSSPGTSDFVAVAPARLADSRPGYPTVDSLFAGTGVRGAGDTLELVVAGRGGVAPDATAVALNVTVTDATAPGFVTVFPCDEPMPTASNLNYVPGVAVPNAVIAKVDAAGTVCLFTSAATQLIVDANGFFPSTTSLRPINPARLLDTRPGHPTVDGVQQGDDLRIPGTITSVQITGRASVPGNATAVVLNVTITEATAPGFVTVFPCGTAVPTASNLNYVTGSTVANLVVSKIGAGGAVCIFNQSGLQLIADINGYFPATTNYHSLNPARLMDTRPGTSTIDGSFLGAGLRAAGTITELTVTNRGGVSAQASAVMLNVTVTESAAAGFVTVYPCGIAPPTASNLNYGVDTTVANAVVVKVGTNGSICLFNFGPTQVIVDVNGYLA